MPVEPSRKSRKRIMKPPILVVEDDPAVAEMVKTLLEAEGYPVREARGSDEALEHLAATEFPIVISDIFLDQRTGLDILRRAHAFYPRCAVILITGKGSFETVLEATREGVFDYIPKPFSLERLVQAVKNAEAAFAQSAPSVADLVNAPDNAHSSALIGNSQAMVEVYKFISRVAETDTTVLLEGETGTGKELVARMIHQSSPRRKGRFAVVDCGALAGTLLETELFGAVRGAYTGADRNRVGMLESADGGTVFLDEIGDIDPPFQLRLLRFLQEREVRPVGSVTARPVNVRVLAATNRNLRSLVAEKKFREDLWYRLNVASIGLPPLRERNQDIAVLVEHFLGIFRQRFGRQITLSPAAMNLARSYHWPGNVRQLLNLLERLAILHPGGAVDEQAFRDALATLDPGGKDPASSDSLADAEEEHIRRVLKATHGNKTRAAEILGIERKTLYRKLEKMRGV